MLKNGGTEMSQKTSESENKSFSYKKEWCSVNPPYELCTRKCCSYCERFQECPYRCSIHKEDECPFRQTEYENFWNFLLDQWEAYPY